MGSGVKSRFPTEDKGEGESSPLSYADILDKMCPDYMAMGMTWQEYWEGDPEMAIAIRKVYEMKQKRERDQRNFDLWLQGMYIYEALIDVSPLFHDFIKEPKALPYRDAPYPLDQEEKERLELRQAEAQDKKVQASVRAWKERVNRMKATKEGGRANG